LKWIEWLKKAPKMLAFTAIVWDLILVPFSFLWEILHFYTILRAERDFMRMYTRCPKEDKVVPFSRCVGSVINRISPCPKAILYKVGRPWVPFRSEGRVQWGGFRCRQAELLTVVQCRARILELIVEGAKTEKQIEETLNAELPSLCARCKATPSPDTCLKYPPPKKVTSKEN